MPMRSMLVLVAGAFGALLPAVAADVPLRDGLYEVAVTLDMGATEDFNARKTVRRCVAADDDNGAHGLFLLSDNQPLAACPVRNFSTSGGALTFDIICEGTDAGRASAVYTFDQDGFEGRISIRMGGKNMTMRETQSGRRIGDCKI